MSLMLRHSGTLILVLSGFVVSNTAALAQTLTAGVPEGNSVRYDPRNQYLTLHVSGLRLPPPNRLSSRLARLLNSVFLDRMQSGLLHVDLEDSNRVVLDSSVLFTYTRESDRRYRYEYVQASEGTPFPVSPFFRHSGIQPVYVEINMKHWEHDPTGVVQRIVSALSDSGDSIPDVGYLLQNTNVILSLIDAVYPPSNREEVFRIAFTSPETIHEQLPILYSENREEFVVLEFGTREALFDDISLLEGVRAAKISESRINEWKELAEEAVGTLPEAGMEPLMTVLTAFARFAQDLGLNKRDQVWLVTLAIHEWARGLVGGETYGGKTLRFTKRDYFRLPGIDSTALPQIDERQMNFVGVNCNSHECYAAAEFLLKSIRLGTKSEAWNNYIRGGVLLIGRDDGVHEFGERDFMDEKKFRVFDTPYWCQVTNTHSRQYLVEAEGNWLKISGDWVEPPVKITTWVSNDGKKAGVKQIDIGGSVGDARCAQ